MNTENNTTEYLTDIKFRNAVKKATKLSVRGKNDSGYRFSVNIDKADTVDRDLRDTTFRVRYYGGDRANVNGMAEVMDRNVRLVQDLAMAGFEIVEVECHRTFSRDTELVRVYRKRAN